MENDRITRNQRVDDLSWKLHKGKVILLIAFIVLTAYIISSQYQTYLQSFYQPFVTVK